MPLERLQKILASAGVASRREAEQMITAGRVSVDGRIQKQLGVRADPRRSRVELDGRRIVAEPKVYGVLHKPRGTVSTLRDPEGRPSVGDLLKGVGARVVPVGRLDYHTSGTLLFTNDGEFLRALQHPSKKVPKVYLAKVKGELAPEGLEKLRERIVIDGKLTQEAEVRLVRREAGKTWVEFRLLEGKNRQVRRLGEHASSFVMRLVRTSQAGIDHGGLRPGKWRFLSSDELSDLKKVYGVPKRVHSAKPLAARRGGAPARPARGASRPQKASKVSPRRRGR
jgi:23S rRNA pseudouridine2605 synthase